MSTRSTNLQRPSALSIHPPSPSIISNPTLSTPTNSTTFPNNLSSPRRAPVPPSPTHSTYSSATVPWLDDRSRRGSFDGVNKLERRSPLLPPSPHKREGKGGFAYAGAYDNKLVSSTLSHLPPLPPSSPTATSNSSTLSSHLIHPHATTFTHLHPPLISKASSFASLTSNPLRPSNSAQSSSSGLHILPNGSGLPSSNTEYERGGSESIGVGRSVHETLVHSSASSPWSLLTVHALPLFAGGPLRTPIEDLNQLCTSHIIATSQRAPPSRLVAVLASDLRDFIASGMLTLKAKFETLEEAKIVGRAAEVWSFFWAQVLPYLEGVFLPFNQVLDIPSSSAEPVATSAISSPPIAVRHLLLSGFLLHILLPLLSRLMPLITNSNNTRAISSPSTTDLQRILQMALVLSTQAKYSSLFPLRNSSENLRRDDELRDDVDSLGKAVRWRMSTESSPQVNLIQRRSLHRGPSMSQGRYRRRGWRASGTFGEQAGPGSEAVTRQNSGLLQPPEQLWGRPRLDEEDEDDSSTPGQSYVYPREGDPSYANSSAGSTLTSGTVRGEILASYGESQRAPHAEFGRRRPMRSESSGSSEANPARR